MSRGRVQEGSKYRASDRPLPVELCARCLLPPAMIHDSVHEGWPTREAHLSRGV